MDVRGLLKVAATEALGQGYLYSKVTTRVQRGQTTIDLQEQKQSRSAESDPTGKRVTEREWKTQRHLGEGRRPDAPLTHLGG